MEDMDEARTADGTVADFSAWDVNNKFGKMKITSKEKVIEPEPTEKEEPDGFINIFFLCIITLYVTLGTMLAVIFTFR